MLKSAPVQSAAWQPGHAPDDWGPLRRPVQGLKLSPRSPPARQIFSGSYTNPLYMPRMVTGPTEDGEGVATAVEKLFPAGEEFSAHASALLKDARQTPGVHAAEGMRRSLRGWGRRHCQGLKGTMRVSKFLERRWYAAIQSVLLVHAGDHQAALTHFLYTQICPSAVCRLAAWPCAG